MRIAFIAALLLPMLAAAQPTAFTYQGRLDSAGVPADGLYDMVFQLFTDATPGTPDTEIGTGNTLNGIAVENGLFSV